MGDINPTACRQKKPNCIIQTECADISTVFFDLHCYLQIYTYKKFAKQKYKQMPMHTG